MYFREFHKGISFFGFAAILLAWTPAQAGPGDACTVANKVYTSESPTTDVLICDAGTMTLKTARSLKTNPVREGIATATPEATLHVEGEAIFGNTGLICSATTEGAIRYETVSNNIEMCDGASWTPLTTKPCDNAPAFLSFNSLTGQTVSTLVTSNIVAVTGMDAGCTALVGVSGTGGSPEYRTCSDSGCATEVQTWTTANNTLDIQGDYIQLRATTSGSANTAFTITLDTGPTSQDWVITTGLTDCGNIGSVCSDGTVYTGLSSVSSTPMFTTRCDAGQLWGGSSCDGAAQSYTWNNGQNASWIDTNADSQDDGQANTPTIVAIDADGISAGFQDHVAAKYCSDLVLHSYSDWYLPAKNELNTLRVNRVAIANFNGVNYYSSSEKPSVSIAQVWVQKFSDGTWPATQKHNFRSLRCVRR